MARWEIAVELRRDGQTPLYRQISRAIADDIRRGRLRPGDALPGARTLARALKVQRLTVVTAIDELAAEGWLVAQERRGVFVSRDLPEMASRQGMPPLSHGISRRFIFDLPPSPPGELPYDVPPGGLLFAPNRPDVRLAPADAIGRAYRRALRDSGSVLLSYGRPHGHERLRAAIATMLSATRGIAASADDVCITRGSQMAFALVARAILRPGDVVAVEELTYRPAVEALRLQGAEIVTVPLDAEGIRLGPVEELAQGGRLRALYLTPHHQYPTTVTLPAARRLRLLDLARQSRFVILEEDYDHEFHYDGSPVMPLASADTHGVVVYIGTLSKVLAPALRVGWIVAPRSVINSAAAHRLHIDVQGDRILEYAIARLMEDGEVQRHIRRTRREYALRRDVLVDALSRHIGGALTFSVPAGGIGLWVRAAAGIDIDAWAVRAREHGAVMVTARRFALNGRSRPFARLGFASLDRRELAEGVRRLARAYRELA